MTGELSQEFKAYLERFESEIGEVEFGSFAKYNGQLVQKLRYDEFAELHHDYHEVKDTYFESLQRGDTINDLVVKLMRELATKLVLESPV